MNCVSQTIAAILMLEKVGITHYDLHSDNVMISNTPFDVHVYITAGDIAMFETYGITPVVIDFGVAYVPDTRLNATTVFTDSGFTTFMNDPLVDTRLLLATAKKDLTKYLKRKSSTRPTGKFRQVNVWPQRHFKSILALKRYKDQLHKMLLPLKTAIDQKTGWLKENTFPHTIHDVIKSEISPLKLNRKGGLFHKDNVKWFLELLQHRINIPLKKELNETHRPFKELFLEFVLEWIHVEQIIRNTKEELFFFKDLVRDIEIVKLKHRYPKIKNISRLRTCVDLLSQSFENVFINAQKEIELKRDTLYSCMVYKTTNDLFRRLSRAPIQFKIGMKVLVCDMRGNLVEYHQLTLNEDQVDLLNENNTDLFSTL